MGSFKKYVTCIMAFFTPLNLSQFVNFTLSLPMCYSLNFTKKLENEKKEHFLHIWLLQPIALPQRRWKIKSLEAIEFLYTHVLTIQIDKVVEL